jgi:hypothetical protein
VPAPNGLGKPPYGGVNLPGSDGLGRGHWRQVLHARRGPVKENGT